VVPKYFRDFEAVNRLLKSKLNGEDYPWASEYDAASKEIQLERRGSGGESKMNEVDLKTRCEHILTNVVQESGTSRIAGV
jgi:hypothetical protein